LCHTGGADALVYVIVQAGHAHGGHQHQAEGDQRYGRARNPPAGRYDQKTVHQNEQKGLAERAHQRRSPRKRDAQQAKRRDAQMPQRIGDAAGDAVQVAKVEPAGDNGVHVQVAVLVLILP
jgi:hypothetical protein